MSTAAISWVLSIEHDDPIEKFVLLALANYADDFGVTWVSQRLIRKCCSCSERKVRTSLKSLEAVGLIVRAPRRLDSGSRTTDATILIGFPRRRVPSSREDHELFGLLDDEAWLKVATRNRHPAPPLATGTTRPAPRRHGPKPPAPGARLEPLIEPLKESIPPTPLCDEVRHDVQTRIRSTRSSHRRQSIAGSWEQAFDQAAQGSIANEPSS